MTTPINSPIWHLQDAIAEAPFAISPSKAQDLKNDPALGNFKLAISGDSGFSIRVDINTHEATLPIFSLEYLWCFSLFVLIFSEAYEAAQAEGKDTADFRQSPEVSQAVGLLNWAYGRMVQGDRSPWPAHTPKPGDPSIAGGIVDAVDQIFLSAIAWIIHHEIAHIRLQHGVETTYSAQEEMEADVEATRWIFSEELSGDMRSRGQLGMAVALLSMQFLEARPGGDTKATSHPPSLVRLDRCFEIAGVNEEGIRAVATVVLQFQLSNLNIENRADGESWGEMLSEAMVSFMTADRR